MAWEMTLTDWLEISRLALGIACCVAAAVVIDVLES